MSLLETTSIVFLLLDNVGLSDINVNYQIRDLNLLDALEKMLYKADIPSRLDIVFHDGKVHIQAIPIVDLSELLQYDKSYGITMIAQTPESSYNHIIALGKGELTERLRLICTFKVIKRGHHQKMMIIKGFAEKHICMIIRVKMMKLHLLKGL